MIMIMKLVSMSEIHTPGTMTTHCRQVKTRQVPYTALDHVGLSGYQCCWIKSRRFVVMT
jgi:hypothetical protein